MKKLIFTLAAVTMAASTMLAFSACDNGNTIYVDTNAFFAPFEYYGGEDGNEIVGVDVEIMELVGKKLGKKVVFENTEFDYIIDNVASGKKYDCGAAGITITPERQEKVDFSTPYFTTVQYVIFANDTFTATGTSTDGKNLEYVLWDQLAGMDIGVQRDTTGDFFVSDEIDGGVLKDTGATCIPYTNAQFAVEAITAGQIDVVVVDQLPATYIANGNDGFSCLALYYDANTASEEKYAICVTKGNTKLLNAINEVIAELGESGINELVAKHLGLE